MVEHISISVELLEQFERGNVLLFVGESINRGALPSSAELAEELAARCDYPLEEPLTLPRVAGYYEMTRNDRHGLIQFLRDRLDCPVLAPLRVHKLVVQLRPRVIVTTCYDRLLERALRDAGIPYIPVIGNAEVAYAEERKVLLVWLWGVLDQPDSIVVTEDDRRLFLEGRVNLSDVLRGELARRTWLFVGFNAEDEWFRSFYDSVNRGLDRQSRRAHIVGATPGAYIRAWWEKRNAEILSADIEPFLAALTDQLAARARPEIPTPRTITAPAEPLPLPEEPYKALVSYEAKDRALFFGRDREIEELAALVHAHRLVLLYGASGVGKTSLLQAGVIPRLEEAKPGYTVVSVRALTDPSAAIRAALRRQLSDIELPSDDAPLVGFLAAATRIGGRPLVLVIDQFEEFFIRLSPEFRAEFIAELGALYDARDLPVKVVLSLREDYLASVDELENRIPEVFHTRMRLLPLTREQARDAIVCPAEALGYSYEPALVEQLLDDLTREGVMPPQLQLVCNALFRHARVERQRTLTVANYEALGGAQGVLRGYLDQELHRFPVEEQALARDLVEELVTSERTKKVKTLTELRTALNADSAMLDAVVERLVRARLLHPVERADTPERAYELAHEYLIDEIVLSPEAIARKEAEELIVQEVDNWRRFGTLLSLEKLELIDVQRNSLRLSCDAQELLLLSALRHGHQVNYWLGRVTDPQHRTAVLTDAAASPLAAERQQAAIALKQFDEPATVPPLLELALRDKDPNVRRAACESLAQLRQQRSVIVQELQSATQTADRAIRGYVLEALAGLPVVGLSAGLRIQVITTRTRLAIKRFGERHLATPPQRAGALFAVVIVIMMGMLYLVLANRYYIDVAPARVEGNPSRVVIRRGSPSLALPGLNTEAVDTGFNLSQYTPDGQEKVAGKHFQGWWFQLDPSGYTRWGQDASAWLVPWKQARAYWYLGDENQTVGLALYWAYTDVRIAALQMLGDLEIAEPAIVDETYIAAITDALEDPNKEARVQAVKVLGQVGAAHKEIADDVVEVLLPLLDDEEPDVRASAASALGEIGSAQTEIASQVVSALLPLLTDKELVGGWTTVGSQAVIALRRVGVADVEAASQVVDVVEEYWHEIGYVDAAETMTQIGLAYPELAPRVVVVLIAHMDEEPWNLSPSAVDQALSELGSAHKEVAPQIIESMLPIPELTLFNGPGRSGRVDALRRILVSQPEVALLMKETLLPDEDWSTRESGALLLGAVAEAHGDIAPQVVEMLVPLLTDDNQAVRVAAAGSLVQLETVDQGVASQAVELLLSVLSDDGGYVRNEAVETYLRRNAIEALRKAGITHAEIAPQAVTGLLAILSHGPGWIRSEAVEALGQVGASHTEVALRVVDGVLPMLSDDDWYVNSSAVEALERVGIAHAEVAPQVVDRLVPMLSDSEEYRSSRGGYIRSSVVGILGQVGAAHAEVAPQVVEALTSGRRELSTGNVCVYYYALGEVGSAHAEMATQVVQTIVNLSGDETKGLVTHCAAPALGEVGTAHREVASQVVEVLMPLAIDKECDPDDRARVIIALGQVGATHAEYAPQAIDILVPLLSDEDRDVRDSAASALVRLWAAQAQQKGEATALLASLASPLDSQKRLIAGRALFLVALQSPSQSTEIRNELQELSERRAPYLRIAANRTLQMLGFADWAWQAINDPEQRDEIEARLRDWQSASFFGEEVNWAAGEALEYISQYTEPD